jgi:hypothetical protein
MPHETHAEQAGAPAEQDMHRALVSLMEELEAVDLYQERAAACSDRPLRDVFLHNKREELEHASMLLEWIRRHEPDFHGPLKKYLFTDAALTALETQPGVARAAPAAPSPQP